MKLCFFLFGISLLLSACEPDLADDAAELLQLHRTVLQAHFENNLEAWMADEAQSTLSVNGGTVTTLERQDRVDARQPYFDNTAFTSYRDLIEPIVKVSDDGSLGWVIAEVEVVGQTERPDGSAQEFANVWAWIELYEKSVDGWKRIGNVSNSRPLNP